jgi:hypothetical protein
MDTSFLHGSSTHGAAAATAAGVGKRAVFLGAGGALPGQKARIHCINIQCFGGSGVKAGRKSLAFCGFVA